LEQKGLLKRFSLSCYGKQDTLEEIRATKAKKFNELKGKRETAEYEEWFLKYEPRGNKALKRESPITPKSRTIKTRTIPSLTAIPTPKAKTRKTKTHTLPPARTIKKRSKRRIKYEGPYARRKFYF
jgi:hypothetical protein